MITFEHANATDENAGDDGGDAVALALVAVDEVAHTIEAGRHSEA